METLYTDLTTTLIPYLKEGISLTSTYLTDFFYRYVAYLIIHDFILLTTGGLLLATGIYYLTKTIKWQNKKDNWSEFGPILVFPFSIMILVGTLMLYNYTFNFIKDLNVPEVRVYEELPKK